jgi:hypothetical protein
MDPMGAVPTVTPSLRLATGTAQYEAESEKNWCPRQDGPLWLVGSGPHFRTLTFSKVGPRPRQYAATYQPRRNLNRESGVTPGVDMSDFHELEDA